MKTEEGRPFDSDLIVRQMLTEKSVVLIFFGNSTQQGEGMTAAFDLVRGNDTFLPLLPERKVHVWQDRSS